MGDTIIEDFIETRLAEISEFILNKSEEFGGMQGFNHEEEIQISSDSIIVSDVSEAEITEPDQNLIEHADKI